MSGRSIDPSPYVLVADDDSEHREHLCSLLKDMGCRVDVAADGVEAVRKTRQSRYDIILMDLGMPSMNGWDAIRRIRQERADTPYIIAVSAYDDTDSRRAAFEAGCHEYVVKPFDVGGAIRAYQYRNRR